MLLLLDEHVTDTLVPILKKRGHQVLLVRERLAAGTPDSVIVAVADKLSAIVVTVDKDFRGLISRRPKHNHNRFRSVGLISFQCGYDWLVRRAEHAFPLIEAEYGLLQTQSDRRLIVGIQKDTILFFR